MNKDKRNVARARGTVVLVPRRGCSSRKETEAELGSTGGILGCWPRWSAWKLRSLDMLR